MEHGVRHECDRRSEILEWNTLGVGYTRNGIYTERDTHGGEYIRSGIYTEWNTYGVEYTQKGIHTNWDIELNAHGVGCIRSGTHRAQSGALLSWPGSVYLSKQAIVQYVDIFLPVSIPPFIPTFHNSEF